MTLKKFKRIARQAIEALPQEFKPYLENVAIAVEPHASDEMLDDMEVPEDEDILGIYEGASLTEGSGELPEMPARIVLYYEPLLDACDTEEELIHEIQTTVLHEIGHHFGLDEERLTELGNE